MPTGLKRKVIRIKAEDSPNVRYALAEIASLFTACLVDAATLVDRPSGEMTIDQSFSA